MTITIGFRNGKELTVSVKSWRWEKSSYGKTLTWEPLGHTKLKTVDVDEILYILES